MNRNTIYAIAGGVVAVLIVAVGSFFYFRGPANQGGVPPLPANARMFNNWALIGCDAPERSGSMRPAPARRQSADAAPRHADDDCPGAERQHRHGCHLAAECRDTRRRHDHADGWHRGQRPDTGVPAGRRARGPSLSPMLSPRKWQPPTPRPSNSPSANGRPVRMNVNTQGFAQGFAAWQQAARLRLLSPILRELLGPPKAPRLPLRRPQRRPPPQPRRRAAGRQGYTAGSQIARTCSMKRHA